MDDLQKHHPLMIAKTDTQYDVCLDDGDSKMLAIRSFIATQLLVSAGLKRPVNLPSQPSHHRPLMHSANAVLAPGILPSIRVGHCFGVPAYLSTAASRGKWKSRQT